VAYSLTYAGRNLRLLHVEMSLRVRFHTLWPSFNEAINETNTGRVERLSVIFAHPHSAAFLTSWTQMRFSNMQYIMFH